MPVTRIADILAQRVHESLELCAEGEAVHWDLTPSVVPDPHGNPSPCYLLLVSIPGALIGERQTGMMTISFGVPHTKERVQEAVRGLVEGMRADRSKMLERNPEPVGHRGVLIGGGAP